MKLSRATFVFLTVFIGLTLSFQTVAVETRGIDGVRNKNVLEPGDFQIIDDFISDAVAKLLETTDFTSVSWARAVIVQRKRSVRSSAQGQYSGQFSKSAYEHIRQALQEASAMEPNEVRFKVIVNLLMLVDELEDLELVRLAFPMLNGQSKVIRYWAVHCITNAGIIEQINSSNPTASGSAKEIVERLKKLVSISEPEELGLIAEFAAKAKAAKAEELLLEIVDIRIKRYADWTVESELLDSSILRMLCDKLVSNSKNIDVARRFGQLYSYAMQRYILDIKGGQFLSESQRSELASVLVDAEKFCIGKLLNRPQSLIKRAVEQDKAAELQREHNKLLGSDASAGELGSKFRFDYGRDAEGNVRTAPLVLPDRPTI